MLIPQGDITTSASWNTPAVEPVQEVVQEVVQEDVQIPEENVQILDEATDDFDPEQV